MYFDRDFLKKNHSGTAVIALVVAMIMIKKHQNSSSTTLFEATGSRNQILNRFQKGYESIENDPYSYPETKEAALKVARGIMNWYRQNKSGDIFNDYDYTKYLEELADKHVSIGAVFDQLYRG